MSDQFQVESIDVSVFATKDELGAAAAARVVACIQQAIRARGQARVIFATGASQYEFLAALVDRKVEVAWAKVTAFHLDEYLGLPETHPASFRCYLRERLFGLLPFGEVHLLDGTAWEPEIEAERYARLLSEDSIDLACIGIGENGHLAFNDPPADFETDQRVHVVTLDEACRRQQVGEGHFATMNDVPARALSLSIPAILAAREISCVVPDARKAKAVQCALRGPVTPDCPASVLRRHSHTVLYLDSESAAGLRS